MAATLRLGVVLAALLLPGAVLVRHAHHGTLRDVALDLEQLPAQLGDHRLLRGETFDEQTLRIIEPETYVMRLYGGEGLPPLWVYAGYYAGRLQTNAHEPTVCYPAFGWEILSSRVVPIPLPDGGALHARLLEAELDGQRELVLYWFQPVGRWPAAPWVEELARVWDAMQGTPQYVFVRQSLPLPAGADPQAAIQRFAQQLAPEIRRLLDAQAAALRAG
jgi:EpsI family protein